MAFRKKNYILPTKLHRRHVANKKDAKDSEAVYYEHTLGLLSPKYEAITACLQLKQSVQ